MRHGSNVEPIVSFLEEHHVSDYALLHRNDIIRVVIRLDSLEEMGALRSRLAEQQWDVDLSQDAAEIVGRPAVDMILRPKNDGDKSYVLVEFKAPSRSGPPGGRGSEYEYDFARWAEHQSHLLKTRDWEHLDVDNVAEEIEDLSRSEHRELRNRLRVLAAHVLKWDHQPAERSRSWAATIREQQDQIEELLTESPSLRELLPQYLAKAYPKSRELAAIETGMPDSAFPSTPPFTPDQLLNVHPVLSER